MFELTYFKISGAGQFPDNVGQVMTGVINRLPHIQIAEGMLMVSSFSGQNYFTACLEDGFVLGQDIGIGGGAYLGGSVEITFPVIVNGKELDPPSPLNMDFGNITIRLDTPADLTNILSRISAMGKNMTQEQVREIVDLHCSWAAFDTP